MPSNQGTIVAAPVRPTSTADTYATAFANEIKGGLHAVADEDERDAIPANRRQEGMRVYVQSTGDTFVLEDGTSNNDWRREARFRVFDTREAAETALIGLAEATTVLILTDEAYQNSSTVSSVVGGTLAHRTTLANGASFSLSDPSAGDAPVYDGSNFVPRPVVFATEEDLQTPTLLSATVETDDGSTPGTGTTYEYQIVAESMTGQHSPAQGASVNGPSSLSNTVYAKLSWLADPNAARYLIYRNESGTYGLIGTTRSGSFEDTGLSADTNETPPAESKASVLGYNGPLQADRVGANELRLFGDAPLTVYDETGRPTASILPDGKVKADSIDADSVVFHEFVDGADAFEAYMDESRGIPHYIGVEAEVSRDLQLNNSDRLYGLEIESLVDGSYGPYEDLDGITVEGLNTTAWVNGADNVNQVAGNYTYADAFGAGVGRLVGVYADAEAGSWTPSAGLKDIYTITPVKAYTYYGGSDDPDAQMAQQVVGVDAELWVDSNARRVDFFAAGGIVGSYAGEHNTVDEITVLHIPKVTEYWDARYNEARNWDTDLQARKVYGIKDELGLHSWLGTLSVGTDVADTAAPGATLIVQQQSTEPVARFRDASGNTVHEITDAGPSAAGSDSQLQQNQNGVLAGTKGLVYKDKRLGLGTSTPTTRFHQRGGGFTLARMPKPSGLQASPSETGSEQVQYNVYAVEPGGAATDAATHTQSIPSGGSGHKVDRAGTDTTGSYLQLEYGEDVSGIAVGDRFQFIRRKYDVRDNLDVFVGGMVPVTVAGIDTSGTYPLLYIEETDVIPESIEIRGSLLRDDGPYVDISWDAVEGAAYYVVSRGSGTGERLLRYTTETSIRDYALTNYNALVNEAVNGNDGNLTAQSTFEGSMLVNATSMDAFKLDESGIDLYDVGLDTQKAFNVLGTRHSGTEYGEAAHIALVSKETEDELNQSFFDPKYIGQRVEAWVDTHDGSQGGGGGRVTGQIVSATAQNTGHDVTGLSVQAHGFNNAYSVIGASIGFGYGNGDSTKANRVWGLVIDGYNIDEQPSMDYTGIYLDAPRWDEYDGDTWYPIKVRGENTISTLGKTLTLGDTQADYGIAHLLMKSLEGDNDYPYIVAFDDDERRRLHIDQSELSLRNASGGHLFSFETSPGGQNEVPGLAIGENALHDATLVVEPFAPGQSVARFKDSTGNTVFEVTESGVNFRGQEDSTETTFDRISVTQGRAQNDYQLTEDVSDLLRFYDSTDTDQLSRFYWDPAGNLRWIVAKGDLYMHAEGATGNGTVYMQTDLQVGDPTQPDQGGEIRHTGRINAYYDPTTGSPALWLGKSYDGDETYNGTTADYIGINPPDGTSFDNFIRLRSEGADRFVVGKNGSLSIDTGAIQTQEDFDRVEQDGRIQCKMTFDPAFVDSDYNSITLESNQIWIEGTSGGSAENTSLYGSFTEITSAGSKKTSVGKIYGEYVYVEDSSLTAVERLYADTNQVYTESTADYVRTSNNHVFAEGTHKEVHGVYNEVDYEGTADQVYGIESWTHAYGSKSTRLVMGLYNEVGGGNWSSGLESTTVDFAANQYLYSYWGGAGHENVKQLVGTLYATEPGDGVVDRVDNILIAGEHFGPVDEVTGIRFANKYLNPWTAETSHNYTDWSQATKAYGIKDDMRLHHRLGTLSVGTDVSDTSSPGATLIVQATPAQLDPIVSVRDGSGSEITSIGKDGGLTLSKDLNADRLINNLSEPNSSANGFAATVSGYAGRDLTLADEPALTGGHIEAALNGPYGPYTDLDRIEIRALRTKALSEGAKGAALLVGHDNLVSAYGGDPEALIGTKTRVDMGSWTSGSGLNDIQLHAGHHTSLTTGGGETQMVEDAIGHVIHSGVGSKTKRFAGFQVQGSIGSSSSSDLVEAVGFRIPSTSVYYNRYNESVSSGTTEWRGQKNYSVKDEVGLHALLGTLSLGTDVADTSAPPARFVVQAADATETLAQFLDTTGSPVFEVTPDGVDFRGQETLETSFDRISVTQGRAANNMALTEDPNDLVRFYDTNDADQLSRFYWDPQGNLRWIVAKGDLYLHPEGGTGNGTVYLQTDLMVGDPNNPDAGGEIRHTGRINARYNPEAGKPAEWLGTSRDGDDTYNPSTLDYMAINPPDGTVFDNFIRFRAEGADQFVVDKEGNPTTGDVLNIGSSNTRIEAKAGPALDFYTFGNRRRLRLHASDGVLVTPSNDYNGDFRVRQANGSELLFNPSGTLSLQAGSGQTEPVLKLDDASGSPLVVAKSTSNRSELLVQGTGSGARFDLFSDSGVGARFGVPGHAQSLSLSVQNRSLAEYHKHYGITFTPTSATGSGATVAVTGDNGKAFEASRENWTRTIGTIYGQAVSGQTNPLLQLEDASQNPLVSISSDGASLQLASTGAFAIDHESHHIDLKPGNGRYVRVEANLRIANRIHTYADDITLNAGKYGARDIILKSEESELARFSANGTFRVTAQAGQTGPVLQLDDSTANPHLTYTLGEGLWSAENEVIRAYDQSADLDLSTLSPGRLVLDREAEELLLVSESGSQKYTVGFGMNQPFENAADIDSLWTNLAGLQTEIRNADIRGITADYTVRPTDAGKILHADTSGGDITITLPEGLGDQPHVRVVNTGTGTVTFAAEGTAMLHATGGLATVAVQYGQADVHYNGSGAWQLTMWSGAGGSVSVSESDLTFDPATQAELNAHTGDTTNPHGVTAAQIGLGSVENVALSAATWADLGIATTDVSKTDVGLGNVPNTNIAYSSPIPADALTSVQVSNLQAATLADGSSPWQANNYFDGTDARAAVGKADVGLGNVENKALSTATWADLSISTSDVSKSDVGLGNVPNTNIAYSSPIPADALTSAEVSALKGATLADGSTPWENNNFYDDLDAQNAINYTHPLLEAVTLRNNEYTDYTSAVGGRLMYDASTGVGIFYGSDGSGVSKGQATLLDTRNTSTGPNLSLTGGASDSSVPSLSILQGAGSGLNADKLDGQHAAAFLRDNASATINAGSSTALSIVHNSDGGEATLYVRGSGQGTGRIYVGQDGSHGGGIEYNGDGTPGSTGAGSDYVTLYRKSGGTYHWTARNKHSNNNWEFRGQVNAQGGLKDNGRDVYHTGNLTPYTDSDARSAVNGSDVKPRTVVLDANTRSGHYETDGALYRYNGQVYLTVDDSFYVRNQGGGSPFHFNADSGRFTANQIYLNGGTWQFESSGALWQDGSNNVNVLTSGTVVIRQPVSGPFAEFDTVNGELNVDGEVLAVNVSSSSDRRLKTNIVPIEGALGRVEQLHGVTFDWKKGGQSAGLIAQDVQQVLPEAVSTKGDHLALRHGALIGLLTQATGELSEKQSLVENRVELFETRADRLERRVDQLEDENTRLKEELEALR